MASATQAFLKHFVQLLLMYSSISLAPDE
jgi:hypothetical protein